MRKNNHIHFTISTDNGVDMLLEDRTFSAEDTVRRLNAYAERL